VTSCAYDLIGADLALGIVGPADEQTSAVAHAQSCAECRAELASLAGVAAAVSELAVSANPPTGFAERVVSRINADSQNSRGGVGGARS
jgi:hypothetical protein